MDYNLLRERLCECSFTPFPMLHNKLQGRHQVIFFHLFIKNAGFPFLK